ncbi:peptide MFS transporter [Psychroserpens sp.]|uniref:peptide MFS transporter n=1 Tax=Psychroserpens sp. TaxID=2020870 RepID=UPI001B21C324|nr:peptide MFS transporter [Psychroserpens sp.]MBO6605840.1 peptide MFS transporter [Psychroserpens sp.]MBO6631511.1 peptide MFS transporter [Psychroserpens sp.]MBO6652789.1 peptide MFS transporter [Psychroserpens sp.]MBO6681439.1 peptide MFS transporter [Psychroserpens sp.]MBO6749214.1 peptide MFS transporter [Psychroserpens sp.]
MNKNSENFFATKVMGHPAGLFVLFFTEMWERFSYYGMRAILVIFLTGMVTGDNPGWGWTTESALSLLGTYALFVYLTPIVGGWLADNKIGYRLAVVIGALLMTLGHASMAVETPTFLYIGIALLILGNGFFKPNMTSIISKMYEGHDDKKDGAYNIFYMGVNAGAFIGIMLCGWVGEKVGWSYGFGLAGIFMFLGMVQFYYAQPLFGDVGAKPKDQDKGIIDTLTDNIDETKEKISGKLNKFVTLDYVLITVFIVSALIFIVNDPLSKIGNIDVLSFDIAGMNDSLFFALLAAIIFIVILIVRIPRYEKVVRDRMIAFTIFCIFTIFFWAAFEQAAGSLPLYTRDFTDRLLVGNAATTFKIIDLIVTVVPIGIITYVLISLFKQTFSRISLSNIVLGISFLIVWAIVIFKLYTEFQSTETEVPVTWFAILNSLFIIIFAPLFTKWWDSKYNPPASVKYGLGLIIMAIGFGLLAFATRNVPLGAESAKLSMIWLVLAYLFHTLGELCLSPMGLSYLSKLIPARMVAFMFGVYYLAIAIGNKMAHYVGGDIEKISNESGLSKFFLIFTIVPIVLGLISFALHPLLKRLMHGVR